MEPNISNSVKDSFIMLIGNFCDGIKNNSTCKNFRHFSMPDTTFADPTGYVYLLSEFPD